MRRDLIGVVLLGATLAALLALVGCGPEDLRAEGTAPLAAGEGNGPNRPPSIAELRIEPTQPIVGDGLRAVAVVRDPDGDPVEIGYRWSIDGQPVMSGEAELDLDDARSGTLIEVVAIPSDGRSEGVAMRARVTVVDRPPVVTGLSVDPPRTVSPTGNVVATAEGSDPDGDIVELRYEWIVNGESSDQRGNTFSAQGLRQGDEIRVRAYARAGHAESRPLESGGVLVGSAHPEITSNPPGFREDGRFVYEVEAVDPDGDRRLRYRLAEAPEGMTIDAVVGRVEWRPTAANEGEHLVSVVVSDTSGLETTQSFPVTVRATESAPPPARRR